MATISIWYRQGDNKPEVVDRASNEIAARNLAHEYRTAFGCAPGQHRYGRDHVWSGRKDQEPKEK